MEPVFSVIIPTFNRAHVLKRSIDSVLKQSYQNFELIIVDDHSTDDTQELIKNYQDQLTSFQTSGDINQGVSKARNLGIKNARGKYIAFLDSDDEWLPEKLKLQYDYFQNHPHIRIVHGEEVWVRNGKRVNPKKIHQKGGGHQFHRCLELCLISPSTVVLEKGLLHQMGGFREDFIVCEDYDLWLKITAENEVGFIQDPLIIKYGGHDDQLSAQYKAMDYYRVKSIDWILDQNKIDSLNFDKAKEVLQKKCKILLKGYQKHKNLKDYHEVLAILKKWE
jgi:glycosyltransferase involved in cell wall biosynthesis